MGSIAKILRGGISGALKPEATQEQPTTVTTTPIAGVAKPTVVTEPPTAQKTQQDQDSNTLAEILKAVNTLNSNMLAGKIGVYMDGQLLSSTLARQTAFKGGYGVNNVNIT